MHRGSGTRSASAARPLWAAPPGATKGAAPPPGFRCTTEPGARRPGVTALDRAPSAGFGFSTAIDGDAIAIGGVNTTNDAGMATGATYVFERDDDRWIQRARLLAPGGRDGDGLGRRV